ncbi:MAG: mandelate racemase/muconate lactonizing enzyme family protein [Chloroflexi bacterium]|nr:mandelate racemase/muconate lactonizing enzyme family protein [Chloroflexota bacterium]
MKITQIEVIPLARNLEQAFVGGTYLITNRNTIVTRIYTDTGLVGEVFGGDEDKTQAEIVSLIRDHFEPLLVGEDPRDVERLWHKMFFCNVDLGNRGLHTLDLHNRGILMQAISAVDMALWDLLGKIYNVPLYKLLGGYRDKVPIIGIGGYYKQDNEEQLLREEIQHYRELGLAGIKLKVGRVALEQDLMRLNIVRQAGGDDFIIICDANQGWTPTDAIEFCHKASPFGVRWIEEPVRWYDQLEGLRLVREGASIPVCAGQGEISGFGCRDLVTRGRVNVLNVDVTLTGGVTEWRRIADMAALFHVQMGHHEEPQVALHLLAAKPNTLYVEIFPDYTRDPMWFDLPVQQPPIHDGFMELPTGPGLGLELNEEVIAKYRV